MDRDATVDMFLESAFFSPDAIAGKARRLGLSSDASYRFERGVDFAATRAALERATQLILEICGGAAGAVTEVMAELPQRAPIRLRLARVSAGAGHGIERSRRLRRCCPACNSTLREDGEEFSVTPPSYRFDLAIEEDLIEEVARALRLRQHPAHCRREAA